MDHGISCFSFLKLAHHQACLCPTVYSSLLSVMQAFSKPRKSSSAISFSTVAVALVFFTLGYATRNFTEVLFKTMQTPLAAKPLPPALLPLGAPLGAPPAGASGTIAPAPSPVTLPPATSPTLKPSAPVPAQQAASGGNVAQTPIPPLPVTLPPATRPSLRPVRPQRAASRGNVAPVPVPVPAPVPTPPVATPVPAPTLTLEPAKAPAAPAAAPIPLPPAPIDLSALNVTTCGGNPLLCKPISNFIDKDSKTAKDLGIPVLPRFLSEPSTNYYSLGKVKAPCLVEISDRVAFRECMKRRAYKRELIIVVVTTNRAELSYHAVQALRSAGYDHIVLLGFERSDCEYIISIDSSLSCVYDDLEKQDAVFQERASKWSLGGVFLAWHKRYKLMCRLSVMGYNVLVMDSDSAPLADEYEMFFTEPMKRFSVFYQREAGPFANGGYFRIQSSNPRGPASHLICYITQLSLRILDSPDDLMVAKYIDPKNGLVRMGHVLMDQDIAAEVISSHAAGYWTPIMTASESWWQRIKGTDLTHNDRMDRNHYLSPPHAHYKVEVLPLSPEVSRVLGGLQTWEIDYHPIYFPKEIAFPTSVIPRENGLLFPKDYKMGTLESDFIKLLQLDGLGKAIMSSPWDLKANGSELMAVGPFWSSTGYPGAGWQGYWDSNDPRYRPKAFHMHVVSSGWFTEDKSNVLMITGNWQYTAAKAAPKSQFHKVLFNNDKNAARIVVFLPDLDFRRSNIGDFVYDTYGTLRAISLLSKRILALPWVDCRSPWIPQKKKPGTRVKLDSDTDKCYHSHCERQFDTYIAVRPEGVRCAPIIGVMSSHIEKRIPDYPGGLFSSQFDAACGPGARPFLFPPEFEALLSLLDPSDLPGKHNTLFYDKAHPGYESAQAIKDLLPHTRTDRQYPPDNIPDYEPGGPPAPLLNVTSAELAKELLRTQGQRVIWLPGSIGGQVNVSKALRVRGSSHVCV